MIWISLPQVCTLLQVAWTGNQALCFLPLIVCSIVLIVQLLQITSN